MLYRGMDRAQLDAAYNNIAAVPLAPNLFADWAARSARFREQQHHGHLGLTYGERRERLDLFLADNPAAPTLAYIHGGYWQMTFQTRAVQRLGRGGAVARSQRGDRRIYPGT
jgi:arylformamidase